MESFTHYEVEYKIKSGDIFVTSCEFKTVEEVIEYANTMVEMSSKNQCTMFPTGILKFTSQKVVEFK